MYVCMNVYKQTPHRQLDKHIYEIRICMIKMNAPSQPSPLTAPFGSFTALNSQNYYEKEKKTITLAV